MDEGMRNLIAREAMQKARNIAERVQAKQRVVLRRWIAKNMIGVWPSDYHHRSLDELLDAVAGQSRCNTEELLEKARMAVVEESEL